MNGMAMTEATIRPRGAVHTVVADACDQYERVNGRFFELVDRLESVLAPERPASPEVTTPTEAPSPLAGEIDGLARRLEGLAGRVQGVLDRLDI